MGQKFSCIASGSTDNRNGSPQQSSSHFNQRHDSLPSNRDLTDHIVPHPSSRPESSGTIKSNTSKRNVKPIYVKEYETSDSIQTPNSTYSRSLLSLGKTQSTRHGQQTKTAGKQNDTPNFNANKGQNVLWQENYKRNQKNGEGKFKSFPHWIEVDFTKLVHKQVYKAFPEVIRYSQDTIFYKFQAIHHTKMIKIKKFLSDLKAGRALVENTPIITVTLRNGLLYTLDNKRLYLFKQYQKSEPNLMIDVRIYLILYFLKISVRNFMFQVLFRSHEKLKHRELKKFTTKNYGTSIEVIDKTKKKRFFGKVKPEINH